MSKLANKAKSSKLKESLQQDSSKTGAKERLVRQIKHKEYPRSYRLDPEIMNTLKNTLDKINGVSPKKVSEARLVKALIWLSKDINEEKILKALKEVW
jgi:hypothetical protein